MFFIKIIKLYKELKQYSSNRLMKAAKESDNANKAYKKAKKAYKISKKYEKQQIKRQSRKKGRNPISYNN